MRPANINEAQWQAITHQGGHLLIVAGPGTGKTHTLTHRIGHLKNIFPQNGVLAITFTQKAAGELKARLTELLPDQNKIFIGTFHSFCLDILKQYSQYTIIPHPFKVACVEEIESWAKSWWPQKKNNQIKDVLEEISKYKSKISELLNLDLLHEYNHHLREKSCLDFDDLLIETIHLFKNHPKTLKDVQSKFSFVCVDEYQDINDVQHELLKLIAGEGVQVTAIGDPNQAIYGFRGSDVHFFETFEDDFPGAVRLSLSENYRSTANILTASGQVIQKSQFSVPELTARIYAQGHLTVHAAATEKAEAEYVVHQIEKLVGGTSMFSHDSGRSVGHEDPQFSFGDIAVLYRLNGQRWALEEAFARSGIPYQVSGEKRPHEEEFQGKVERVNLLTLHASKGLEFAVVFIIGCEENLLPLCLENFETDLEEERRLFYVGMTRAKERLFLARSLKRQLFGRFFENAPSPFLSDIEESLKEYEKSELKKKRKPEGVQLNLFKV